MPHISRRRLKQKTFDDITGQFIVAIARLDKKSARSFYKQFFTKTERVMFAKRLAIIFLLQKGFSTYRVSQALCVSESTVYRLEMQFSEQEKNKLLTEFSGPAVDAFFKELSELFLEGFSMSGKRRAAWLKKIDS